MLIPSYTYFLPESARPGDWFLVQCFRVLVEERFTITNDPVELRILECDLFLSKRKFRFEKFIQNPLSVKYWKQVGQEKESMRLTQHLETVFVDTEEGDTHLFLVSPISGPAAGEREIEKVDAVKGLLGIVFGRNFLYQLESQFFIDKTSELHIVSDEVREPLVFQSADERIAMNFNSAFLESFDRLSTIDRRAREKILLSLRWINNAARYDNEIDQLVSVWIAIETLALESDSNIIPIQKAMKVIYPDYEEKDHFHVGHLYKLRCDIVHAGSQKRLPPAVIEFARAVYYDLLMNSLSLNSEAYTDALAAATGFDMQKFYNDFGLTS